MGNHAEHLVARNRTHGLSGTRMHTIWRGIIQRCESKAYRAYPNYGGRGITICPKWRNDFLAFIADMGECPPGLTIERIDNDRGYEPGNCRWATRAEQNRNKRANVNLTHDGRTMNLAAWAREIGVNITTLRERLTRQPVDAALSMPKQPVGRRAAPSEAGGEGRGTKP